MASEMSADAGGPNLNLNPEEKRVYGQLFRQADSDSVGVVTGEVAVKFFEKTRLDSSVLGEIWQIADKENRGFLTPAGFGIVLRLIGHAQRGQAPTAEIALQPGPIPRFDGFAPTPAPTGTLSAQGTGSAGAATLQAQGTGGGGIRIPPLTPEKVAQYTSLFERQNLKPGNILPGDQAKQIFEKSGLPNEMLGRIWMLADTEQRGALVVPEFVIAMHLLTSTKSGVLRGLPNVLPAGLYEAATRKASPGPQRQQSPGGAGSAFGPIPRQLSGQAGMRTGSPLGRPPMTAQSTNEDWLITPQEKARCDTLFQELDKGKKGYITGEEAVPFLSQSNLPEDALAQIWDLADFKSEGSLKPDTFAVAMHLIRQARGKRDGGNALPATLPPNLIPPSMRSQIRAPQASASSAFPAPPVPPPTQQATPAPPPQPKSALDDLFGLDASTPAPAPAPAPAQVAMGTGGSNAPNDPFGSNASPIAPSSPHRASPTVSSFKPFVPSSSFGRTLTAQPTGGSTSSAPSASKPSPMDDDLLGDADGEATRNLSNETTELANLSNQVGSLSKHMQEVQGKRNSTQKELNQASAQKKAFEERLAQLRTLYENEAKDVRTLEDQLNASRSETRKIQGEAMTLEGTLQDLQNQHRQIATALQADQQENADLKTRIRTVNAEVAQLKPQIEKLKSEARQQKGLVAINKKQLSTVEGERDKLKSEAEDLTKSNAEMARQINSSSPQGQVASPALSTTSGNNPFFRRTGSTDIMGAFTSSSAKAANERSFDDVFGPSFPPAPASAAALPAFKPQTTGTSTGSAASFATPATGNTPSISRQPTALEPPAPPASRQMSSSVLPFGGEASGSVSSSVQVSPPLSRSGPPDAGLAEPSSTTTAAPLEAIATGQSSTSVGSDTETEQTPASTAEGKPSEQGGSAFGGSSADTTSAPTSNHKHNDGADPFSAMNQAKAKEDFENAFASFKNAKAKGPEPTTSENPKSFSAFDTEFPPISELEQDESDSESDKGGFDDDFAPASPKAVEKSLGSKPASPTLAKSTPAAETTPVTEPSTSAAAPPSSERDQTPQATQTIVSNVTAPKVDNIFGSSEVQGSSSGLGNAARAPSDDDNDDDDDDDFEGLEDAKEGSADDDFANISRSGLDDFNPVFDSSPPQSHTAKSESNLTGTTAQFGGESSFDFGSLGSSTAGNLNVGAGGPTTTEQNGAAATSAGAKAPGASDNQDWDAIFASLDDTGPSASLSQPSKAEDDRPTLGRALTEAGEHDDPLLKNLTGMGYSRADALVALEKYDYNLDRAANHLASQS